MEIFLVLIILQSVFGPRLRCRLAGFARTGFDLGRVIVDGFTFHR
jgi:hypothetical protein